MATLPVLPLQYPVLLLPASRITVPVKKEVGQQLISLIHESEAQPVVAAVPIINPESAQDEEPVLNEWGTSARIARLVRPSALNPSENFLVTLHGLTRVRLAKPLQIASGTLDEMPYHSVEYPPTEGAPQREQVIAFKGAALRLLDRLKLDAPKGSQKDTWSKFASMVEEISDSRVGWLADVMVAGIIVDYSDRLSECLSLCAALPRIFYPIAHKMKFRFPCGVQC